LGDTSIPLLLAQIRRITLFSSEISIFSFGPAAFANIARTIASFEESFFGPEPVPALGALGSVTGTTAAAAGVGAPAAVWMRNGM